MSNFKFTGVNIAAALLIIAYFFPWVSAMGMMSMSGFSIMSNGISPGMMGMFLKGLDRLFMILVILIPLCGAIILYQNITNNKKFSKYYKTAHLAPAVILIVGVITMYFKMKPDVSDLPKSIYGDQMSEELAKAASRMNDMAPGVFDVLSIGFYISLIAAVYLLLVSIGKIKDKEYYKPAASPASNQDNNAPPPNQG
jgi:asparagine N-glycosylation enzyme membrane subunit Stt3